MNSIARKRLVMAHAITSSEGSEQHRLHPREGYPTPFRFIEYDSYSDGPEKNASTRRARAVFQTPSEATVEGT